MGAGFDLLGLFGEQHALVERLEELAVEFGAVGDDDNGGVFEFGVAGDEVGVELHFHGFAGALGVPDDARFSVRFDGQYGAADCFGDGKVLVGFRDAFGEAVAVLVEGGVAAQQLQEAVLVVETVDGVFEAGDGFAVDGAVGVDGIAVVVDVPGREVVEGREGGAVFGVDSVAGEGEDAVAESEGEFAQVGVKLGVGGGDIRSFGAGFFEFDDADGHAVAVEHQVESSFVVALGEGDLVDGEPVVLVGVGGEQADGGVVFGAVGVDVAEAESVDKVLVNAKVFGDRIFRLRRRNLGNSLRKVLGGHGRVELLQCRKQAGADEELIPTVTLTRAGCDLLARKRTPPQVSKSLESEVFPVCF